MTRVSSTFGGSAAAGGFGFQANIGAIASIHTLRGTPVQWTDGLAGAAPCAVSFETSGPGDDLSLELADGSTVEIQVKRGLRADGRFWSAVDALCEGIRCDVSDETRACSPALTIESGARLPSEPGLPPAVSLHSLQAGWPSGVPSGSVHRTAEALGRRIGGGPVEQPAQGGEIGVLDEHRHARRRKLLAGRPPGFCKCDLRPARLGGNENFVREDRRRFGDPGFLHGRAGSGPGALRRAGDLQHRPGQPVHRLRLHRPPAGSRHPRPRRAPHAASGDRYFFEGVLRRPDRPTLPSTAQMRPSEFQLFIALAR